MRKGLGAGEVLKSSSCEKSIRNWRSIKILEEQFWVTMRPTQRPGRE